MHGSCMLMYTHFKMYMYAGLLCDFPVYFEEAVFSRKSDGWLVVNMIL